MFYNENFEKSVLSSIIFEPELLHDVADRLQEKHFFMSSHQDIYSAILTLDRKGYPISEDFILKEAGQKYQDALVGIMIQNPISNVMPYIVEMIELYAKREIHRLSTVILKEIDSGKGSEAIMSGISSYIDKIETSNHSRSKTFDELKEKYLNTPRPPLHETGVQFLDKSFGGGFKMGQLILVSGDPEAGKTMLVMQILKNVSKHYPVCLFAFEFTVDSMIELQLDTEGKDYQNPNMHIIDDGFDIFDIETEIKDKAKRGVKFFVIDSQMRIENSANTGTVEERESEKFSRLAKLSHKLKIAILLIIQNSKADAAASVISPMGSKKGAHEASIIMHLRRLKDNEETGEKEMRELIVSKNKQNGVHFKGKIKFNPFTKTFSAAGTPEEKSYEDKNKPIPVEHQDASGKTTKKSQYQPSLESNEAIEMPFMGE